MKKTDGRGTVRALLRAAGLPAALLCLGTTGAAAAGYQLNEIDATSVGMALSGNAVLHTPGGQSNNPAGLANLRGTQLQVGSNVFFVNSTLTNAGSTSLLGTPQTGGVGDLTLTIPTPFLYVSHAFTDRITGGFAINSNFGLGTHYPDGWFGRYFALNTDLKTVDLNPNIAYKVTDDFSVGVGVFVRYAKARVTHAIDLGAIGLASRIPGSVPGAQDGIVRLDADETGAGFKLGADWHVTPATEFGISFRSGMNSTLRGRAKFFLTPPGTVISAASGALVTTGASAKSADPASVTAGLSHALTPELTLYGELDWVNWSVFKELRFEFLNPAQPPAGVVGNWRDTWKVALGATYKLTPTIELRGGTAWEESPIRGSVTRTALLPDSNRIWLSAGVGWSVTPSTQVNFGYSHLFFADTNLLNVDASTGVLRANTSDGHADILSLDVVMKF
jgi:long-chain fatty acid transport protein